MLYALNLCSTICHKTGGEKLGIFCFQTILVLSAFQHPWMIVAYINIYLYLYKYLWCVCIIMVFIFQSIKTGFFLSIPQFIFILALYQSENLWFLTPSIYLLIMCILKHIIFTVRFGSHDPWYLP